MICLRRLGASYNLVRKNTRLSLSKMDASNTAESSKRALSSSPSRQLVEGDHPSKKRAVDTEVSPSIETQIDGSGSVPGGDAQGTIANAIPLKSEEEASNRMTSTSTSQELTGESRRGYKGKNKDDRRANHGRGPGKAKGERVDSRGDRKGNHGWEKRGNERKDSDDEDAEGPDGDKVKRLPKKKVAILLGSVVIFALVVSARARC